MRNVTKSELQRTFIVCIDSFESGVPVGRLYGGKCQKGRCFSSLMQFLLGVDACLDENNFPQAFSQMRQFAPRTQKSTAEPDSEMIREGERATFSIRILFRQNASWQGYVSWLEGGGEESFRSALELLFLMNSALEGNAEPMGEAV